MHTDVIKIYGIVQNSVQIGQPQLQL